MKARRSTFSPNSKLPREIRIQRSGSPSPNCGKRGAMIKTPSPKRPCADTPLTNASATSHSVARSVVTMGDPKTPPPPPPKTPPPKPTEIVKILCLGSEALTRRRWLHHLVRRHAKVVESTPVKPQGDGNEEDQTEECSLEYLKKDYSFQSASGEARSVRLQFLHLDGIPGESPPASWEKIRHKIHSALLIVDLPHLICMSRSDELESYLDQWRRRVDAWTHGLLPVNLLVANVLDSPCPASTAELLRVGAALAGACRSRRTFGWFLVGADMEGIDSIDAVLQSLVQQADTLPPSNNTRESPGSASIKTVLSPLGGE